MFAFIQVVVSNIYANNTNDYLYLGEWVCLLMWHKNKRLTNCNYRWEIFELCMYMHEYILRVQEDLTGGENFKLYN
jgi:hypothetical protein